jgi:hypothetical protein
VVKVTVKFTREEKHSQWTESQLSLEWELEQQLFLPRHQFLIEVEGAGSVKSPLGPAYVAEAMVEVMRLECEYRYRFTVYKLLGPPDPYVAWGGPEKKQASLCSDNVAGGRGWHCREIKLKESNVK